MAAVNANLLRIETTLPERISQALEACDPTLDSLNKLLPPLDVHLRVTRQIDRFAQLNLRAAERCAKKNGHR